MICEHCGGEVVWVGTITNLQGTKCKQCGGTNCQYVFQDEDELQEACVHNVHDDEICEICDSPKLSGGQS